MIVKPRLGSGDTIIENFRSWNAKKISILSHGCFSKASATPTHMRKNILRSHSTSLQLEKKVSF